MAPRIPSSWLTRPAATGSSSAAPSSRQPLTEPPSADREAGADVGDLVRPAGAGGVSDDGLSYGRFRADPAHWVTVRPPEIGRHWEKHGTWLRPPILIDRRLLAPSDSGLQVVEGRTRVGVLRGRLREELHVASNHQAWVGHPTTAPGTENRPNTADRAC